MPDSVEGQVCNHEHLASHYDSTCSMDTVALLRVYKSAYKHMPAEHRCHIAKISDEHANTLNPDGGNGAD